MSGIRPNRWIATAAMLKNEMSCFRIKFWRYVLLIAAMQLLSYPAYGCSAITLISSNSHFGMVHRIEAALFGEPHSKLKIVHLIAEKVQGLAFFDQYADSCLIVTIGSESLAAVLKTQTKKPILSVLCRKNIFHSILKEHHRRLHDPKYPITSIYLDQPLKRQLNLLQCLLPKQDWHIGILLGPNSSEEQEVLQKLANERKLTLTSVYVNNTENPVAVLDALINDAKVVLALPDNKIYNPKTARGMLLTAFHKRIPIVGYSRTYVNNGALAAVYSTTKQLADQTAHQILHIIKNKDNALSAPMYPEEFAIAVNYQVARSLARAIESEASLKNAMDKMENNEKTHV